MKKLIWLLFLLALFIAAYFREVFFQSINAIIAGNTFFYANTMEIEFLQNFTPAELVKVKIGLTVFFTLLFMALTAYGLKLSFKIKLPFSLAVLLYFLISGIAFLLLVFSYFTNSFNEIYSTLRLFIEYLHTPILFLILSAGAIAMRFIKSET